MSKLIGCKCSEKQLDLVGCECVVMVVRIQPLGYASDKDVSLEMAQGMEYNVEAFHRHGPCAKIVSITERNPLPRPSLPESYCRAMSSKDNS